MSTTQPTGAVDGTTVDQQDTAQTAAVTPEQVALADTIVQCDHCGLLVDQGDNDGHCALCVETQRNLDAVRVEVAYEVLEGFSRTAAIC